jgi:hypothetical protein
VPTLGSPAASPAPAAPSSFGSASRAPPHSRRLERRRAFQQEPPNPHRILAMVFDNCWHTNFVADSHGTFEFQFDLAWRPNLTHPQDLAESISTDPILTTNTTIGETPAEHDNLHRR